MDPNKPISAQDLQLFETIWKRVGLDDDFDREAILRSKKSILDLIDESNELIHQSRGNLNKEVQLFTNHGNGLIKYFWKVEYDNKMGVDASFFFNKGQWMLSESKPLSSTKSTPPSHFQILSIFLKNAQNNESVDSNKIKEAQALINDKNTSINELEKFIQKLSWSDLGLSIDISWFNGETNKNTNGLELSPSPNDLIPEIPAFLGDLHLYGESTHKVPWNDPYALILVCDFLRSSGLEYESKDEQMANQIAKPLSRSHQSLRKVLDSNFSKINTTDLYSALVNYRLDEMTKIVKKQYISQNEDDKITIHKIIPLDSQKFPFGLYKFQGLPILKISKDDYDIIFESFTPLGEKHEIARIPLSSRRFKTLEQVDDHQFMIRSDQMEVPLEIYFPDSYTQRTKEVILFNIAYAFAQIPKSYLSLFKGDKNEDSIRVVFASQEKAKALGLDSKLPASGVYNPFNNTLWVALSEKTLEASSLGAPDIISTFWHEGLGHGIDDFMEQENTLAMMSLKDDNFLSHYIAYRLRSIFNEKEIIEYDQLLLQSLKATQENDQATSQDISQKLSIYRKRAAEAFLHPYAIEGTAGIFSNIQYPAEYFAVAMEYFGLVLSGESKWDDIIEKEPLIRSIGAYYLKTEYGNQASVVESSQELLSENSIRTYALENLIFPTQLMEISTAPINIVEPFKLGLELSLAHNQEKDFAMQFISHFKLGQFYLSDIPYVFWTPYLNFGLTDLKEEQSDLYAVGLRAESFQFALGLELFSSAIFVNEPERSFGSQLVFDRQFGGKGTQFRPLIKGGYDFLGDQQWIYSFGLEISH